MQKLSVGRTSKLSCKKAVSVLQQAIFNLLPWRYEGYIDTEEGGFQEQKANVVVNCYPFTTSRFHTVLRWNQLYPLP